MAALRNRIGIFQITNWDNFGHKLSSFRGFIYATKRAALITCKTVKQKSYIQIECSFFVAERKGFEPLRALWALHDFQSCALDQLSHLSTWKPEAVVSGLSDTVKNRITIQRHSDAVNVSATPTARALLPPQIFGSYYEEAHSFPDREAAAAHAPSPAVPSTRNRKRPEE